MRYEYFFCESVGVGAYDDPHRAQSNFFTFLGEGGDRVSGGRSFAPLQKLLQSPLGDSPLTEGG